MNQIVQLRRDNKQYEREDARHERERQEALEDERRKQREEQYVVLLTALTELDRPLEDTSLLVPELVDNREHAEGPKALSGDIERAIVDTLARSCRQSWEAVEAAHRDLTGAFFVAYAVASPTVREQGRRIADWLLGIATVEVKMLTDHDFKRYAALGEGGHKEMDRRSYMAHVLSRIDELRSLIAELDRLLREELRLA